MPEINLNPHQYFLSLHATFKNEIIYKGQLIKCNVLERRGIDFRMNAAVFDPANPGEYNPIYHRQLVRARLNDFNLSGLTSEIVGKISDRDQIISTDDTWNERLLFESIHKVNINWREPLPKEPPAFGSKEFNRYASHPMVLRYYLSKLNREDLEKAHSTLRRLQSFDDNPLNNSLAEFTQLVVNFFENWYVANALEVPEKPESTRLNTVAPSKDGLEQGGAEIISTGISGTRIEIEPALNIFRRTPDYWQIVYEGEKTFLIARLIGLYYIKNLLSTPKNGWDYKDLQFDLEDMKNVLPDDDGPIHDADKDDDEEAEEIDTGEVGANKVGTTDQMHTELKKTDANPTRQSRQPIQDPRYKKELQDELNMLEKAMERADIDGDNKKYELAQKKYTELLSFRQRDTYRGKSKDLNKIRTYTYHNVYRAILRIFDKLERPNPALYAHLKEHIDFSIDSCSYGEKLKKPPLWIT